MENYDQLIDRISRASDLSKEEIQKKVDAKRSKLSGLVSKEGAAQIVAAELGINFDKERIKISELIQGMKRVNVLGKIIEVYPFREFNKNGREGRVGSFLLADDSSNTRIVMWDVNQLNLFESGKMKAGDIIEIGNGSVRNGEIHLSSFSDLRLSREKLDGVVEKKAVKQAQINEMNNGDSVKTRAFIVQSFEPRYFEVCKECGKRVLEGECKIHGKVETQKKALLNLVLDDGTETIRAVIFGKDINKLGLLDEEIFSIEKFNEKKNDLLGEEMYFSGNVRQNQLYNNTEFMINGVEKLNVDEFIKELEAKVSS